MQTQSIKEAFARSGSDRLTTPAMSRAQRLAKVAPPIVAEALERRRMLSLTISTAGGALTVTGDGTAQLIDLYNDGNFPNDSIVIVENGVPADSIDPSTITSGPIVVSGAGGNDTIDVAGGGYPLPQLLVLYGDDGNDDIRGFVAVDTIYGGNGNDLIHGYDGDDLVYGGDGNDVLHGDLGDDIIRGGVGYDTVYGGDDDDAIFGGGGGGVSDDSVTGFDLLYGDVGNDSIFGEGGGDTLYGGVDDDSLSGGDFADYIDGGDNADSLFGDDGDDSIYAREGVPQVTDILDGGAGNDSGWWDSLVDTTSNMEGNHTP